MSAKPYTDYAGRLGEIVFKPQTKNSKGGVVAYCLPNKEATSNMRMRLQIDQNDVKCKAPFGVSCFDDTNASRKTLELSIENSKLVELFRDFDEKNVDFAMQNASQWFKQKDLTRDQVKNMYYPMIQLDQSGKGYAPKLHTKLNTDGRNKVNVLRYFEDASGKGKYCKGSIDDIVKFSDLMVNVEASSMWFQSKQFGMSLLVTDVVVFPKEDRKEFDFGWSAEPPVNVDSIVLCKDVPASSNMSSSILFGSADSSSSSNSSSNGVTLLPLEEGTAEPVAKKPRVAKR